MISFIKGKIKSYNNGYIILESNNMGFKINMSNPMIDKISRSDEEKVIYTYLRVLEDDLSLFGFNSQEELNMFELMLSVSGIGAKTALTMLGELSPDEFSLAVINEDISKITKIPGIGPKGAKRIILELKDKVKLSNQDLKNDEIGTIKTNNENDLQEAISALIVLGYLKKDIINVFKQLDTSGKTSQDLIKIGLKYLS